MSPSLITVSYLASAALFILALSGLSNNETARRGNMFGIVGMIIAIIVTVAAFVTRNYNLLVVLMVVGGLIGFVLSRKVQMTQMPELVAILHSLVGLAAVLIGFANFMDTTIVFSGVEKTIHEIEIYLGVAIGALTFTGSVVAYGKLSGMLGGAPMLLPARHWLNLIAFIAVVIIGVKFVGAEHAEGTTWLLAMTVIALLFGIHMVAAIGGADMPVVISMLNSYSGWAAAATGFMLSNDLLIVTEALVGSSGAILSYIMCRAMNRQFISVIAGGFGTESGGGGAGPAIEGEVQTIDIPNMAQLLKNAKEVMVVPGYGMATAQAQHAIAAIAKDLTEKGINVRFGIHPVAGRMPGHMNVLLAEAKVPYDMVFEMDEINDDFPDIDVSIVVGANDTVNPLAQEDAESPIAGMPVLEVWKGKTTVVLKRGMAAGYAGVDNPLFVRDNTRMLFGDARESLTALAEAI